VAHVGDSRLYLVRKGRIRQLTADDSWAATILAHDPRMKPSDLAHHPMRNVLTNVLGARDQVDVHVAEHDLEHDDVVLICSDGLHGMLDDATIAQIAGSQRDLHVATRQMVTAALDKLKARGRQQRWISQSPDEDEERTVDQVAAGDPPQ